MPWDDLRVFLAIARAGSLAGAARSLAVNHSTVFRRINAFEESLGVRLFDRMGTGYALTVAGEEMRASAERVEREIDRLDRRITGQDLRLEGTLVVTTTDTIAQYILMPHLANFRTAYPGIQLELIIENANVNMSKRQADVAVRPTRTPPETLVGRRISNLAFAAYASTTYMQGRTANLAELDWVRLDDSLLHLAADQWFRRTLSNAKSALTTNSVLGLLLGCEADLGATVIPCFMADTNHKLQRIVPPIDDAASILWLLTHEDLRHTARVRPFMDFMADALKADIDLLEGRVRKLALTGAQKT